jgi:putative ATP-binding cassette transporter
MLILAILTGIIAGLSNAGLLILISTALSRTASLPTYLYWVFGGLCVLVPLLRFASQTLLLNLSQAATYDLRVNLSSRILSAPLRQLEEIGRHRLIATLTDDVLVISSGLMSLPPLCLHGAIILGCLLYLAWLSPVVLLGVIGFLCLTVFTFKLASKKALRSMRLAREEQDVLFGHFRGMSEGTKELKLHRARRHEFLNQLLQNTAAAYRKHTIRGGIIYTAAGTWAQFMHFTLIGLLLFVLPRIGQTTAPLLTGYIIIMLYMMVPLDMIMGQLPILARASVALKKVESLGLSLMASPVEDAPSSRFIAQPSWNTLELANVTHSYFREHENSSFTLGPINLSIHPGELVFLVGGNGSGKTTLAKLLIGLYSPETGVIRLDGEAITDANRESYRQLFSVVFSDFYLFESFLGMENKGLDERVQKYLVQLQLEHKVQVRDGRLSTLDLSQGQRKRLALLTAYLEDRPVYVFDEWAADQDPLFKDIFYYDLLPELKARGKSVIVISHDDHYYDLADRIIKLDYGKVESVKNTLDSVETPVAETPVEVFT